MEKTFTFEKTKTIDIDTFVTVSDEKTFDIETGERVSFIRTVTFKDYTGKICVSKKVMQ